MKKVGIITVHRLPNWGSVMQGYALQKVIEKLGYNCECIDYIYPNEWHISKGCWSPQHISLKNKIARFLGFRPPLLSSLVDEFIKNEMNVSRCYRSYDEIHKIHHVMISMFQVVTKYGTGRLCIWTLLIYWILLQRRVV